MSFMQNKIKDMKAAITEIDCEIHSLRLCNLQYRDYFRKADIQTSPKQPYVLPLFLDRLHHLLHTAHVDIKFELPQKKIEWKRKKKKEQWSKKVTECRVKVVKIKPNLEKMIWQIIS